MYIYVKKNRIKGVSYEKEGRRCSEENKTQTPNDPSDSGKQHQQKQVENQMMD